MINIINIHSILIIVTSLNYLTSLRIFSIFRWIRSAFCWQLSSYLSRVVICLSPIFFSFIVCSIFKPISYCFMCLWSNNSSTHNIYFISIISFCKILSPSFDLPVQIFYLRCLLPSTKNSIRKAPTFVDAFSLIYVRKIATFYFSFLDQFSDTLKAIRISKWFRWNDTYTHCNNNYQTYTFFN